MGTTSEGSAHDCVCKQTDSAKVRKCDRTNVRATRNEWCGEIDISATADKTADKIEHAGSGRGESMGQGSGEERDGAKGGDEDGGLRDGTEMGRCEGIKNAGASVPKSEGD